MDDLQLLLQVSYTNKNKYNTEHCALCYADIECSVSDGLHQRQQPHTTNYFQ